MPDALKKDIDFDELHQAVNALMDKAQKGKTAKRLPKQPAFNDATQPAGVADAKPAPSTSDAPEDNRIAVTVKRNLPLLTSHRGSRGRAMDVVGRRPPVVVTPPSAQTKREAPSLKPSGVVRPDPITPITPPAPASQPEVDKAEPSDDVLASINMHDSPSGPTLTHQKNEWPDPLDIHGFKTDDEPKTPKEAADHDATADEPEKPAEEKPAESSDTPFVVTKVEKRPLGAYAEAAAEKPTDEPQPHEAPDEKADTPSPLPSQRQPAELSPEVVAVESAETELPGDTQQEESGVDSLRTMAITQQYNEAEKAANTDARPVFDTTEYHPAIAAHASPRNSALGSWIMGIALVVLLVGALGVAYYLITGGLDFSALIPS